MDDDKCASGPYISREGVTGVVHWSTTRVGEMSVQINRTSLQLYRDCMRLAAYIAPRSTPKGAKLRAMITEQFRAHRFETDPTKVEECKQAYVSSTGHAGGAPLMGTLWR